MEYGARCGGRSVVLVVVLAVGCAASASEDDVTCALIPVVGEGAEAIPIVPLLELELASRGGFRLVERERIDAVLDEIVLQTAVGEDGFKARRQLSTLLRADLLITIVQQQRDKLTELRLSVAESKLGLRLVSANYAWDENTADALVAEMADAIARARETNERGITAIVAVPPFECEDTTFDYSHLMGAYAALVEQSAMAYSGLLAVELSEAKALTRELALTSGDLSVRRRLPFYLIGSYRNDGYGPQRRMRVRIELQRSGKTLASTTKDNLAPEGMRAFLQNALAGLVPKMEVSTAATPADPKIEADLLHARAEHFLRIGNFDEALVLNEAALLLQPNRVDLHCATAQVLGKLVRMCDQPYTTLTEARRRQRDIARYYRIGQQHLEHALFADLTAWEKYHDPLADFLRSTYQFRRTYPFMLEELKAETEAMFTRVLASLTRLDPGDDDLREGLAGVLQELRLRRKAVRDEKKRREEDRKRFAKRARARKKEADKLRAKRRRAERAKAGIVPITAEFWQERFEKIRVLPDHADALERIRELVKRPGGVSIFDSKWAKFLDDVEQLASQTAKTVVGEARDSIRRQQEINSANVAKRKRESQEAVKKRRAELAAERARRQARQREAAVGPDMEPLRKTTEVPGGGSGPSVRIGALLAVKKRWDPDRPPNALHNIHDGDQWLACGEGVDVLAHQGSLWVMKKRGLFERVVKCDGRISSICYDGRYVWAPFADTEPGLAVFDPRTEQVWQFTREDGMMPISTFAAIAPMGPGKVCLVAEFSESGRTRQRTWVAVLTMSGNGELNVDVLDTARIAPGGSGSVQWSKDSQDPDVASMPTSLCPLSDPAKGENRGFLMFRRQKPPLRIDIDKRVVDLPTDLFGTTVRPRNGTWHRGYLIWHVGERLWRAAPPDFKLELLMKIKIPMRGNRFLDGDWLHVLTRDNWRCANLATGEVFLVTDEMPHKEGVTKGGFRLVRSSHYGWIVLGQWVEPRAVDLKYPQPEDP